jgi:hypothetical protein
MLTDVRTDIVCAITRCVIAFAEAVEGRRLGGRDLPAVWPISASSETSQASTSALADPAVLEVVEAVRGGMPLRRLWHVKSRKHAGLALRGRRLSIQDSRHKAFAVSGCRVCLSPMPQQPSAKHVSQHWLHVRGSNEGTESLFASGLRAA